MCVIFYCVTNTYKTGWLKTKHLFISEVGDSGRSQQRRLPPLHTAPIVAWLENPLPRWLTPSRAGWQQQLDGWRGVRTASLRNLWETFPCWSPHGPVSKVTGILRDWGRSHITSYKRSVGKNTESLSTVVMGSPDSRQLIDSYFYTRNDRITQHEGYVKWEIRRSWTV